MISLQEALEIIRENLPQLKTESEPVSRSLNRVLAGDVQAPEPSPRFTNSAMDGFAVRWEDVEPASQGESMRLTVVGESRAGLPYTGSVRPGEAVRINTGAVVPEETDTVIPVEDTEIDGRLVTIKLAVRKAQHVRFAGEEFREGDVVLTKGSVITPAVVGLLASLGVEQVPVYRRPRVAVLVTGSELVAGGEELLSGQIRDSNGPMLAAAVEASGGDVVLRAPVPDDSHATRKMVEKAAEQADLLLFSGGVSVGPHDFVKKAATEAGFATLFWRVRQKPGKPLFLARKEETLLFGLPGNPVSALNCFAYYVQPVISHLLGRTFHWERKEALLITTVQNEGKRTTFVRVQIPDLWSERPQAMPLALQGSHMLTSMAQADGFLLLQPESALAAGELVTVYLYPWRRQ